MKLKLLWLVSLVATMGSLYFSEVRNFVPCSLCWYQRILMYPMVILGIVSIVRNDKKVVYYVLPISILGMLVAGYHYLKQKVEWFNEATGACVIGVPCNAEYINWFNFITIPFLSFIAFTMITIVSILIMKDSKKSV